MSFSGYFLKLRRAEFREKGVAIDLAIENGKDYAYSKWYGEGEYLGAPNDKDCFLPGTKCECLLQCCRSFSTIGHK